MKIQPFELERYFARHEFSARYLLGASDCESLGMQELLALGDAQARALWDGLGLGYTESPGHSLLRAEIARQYPGLDAQRILTTVPEEAIFIAMNVLLRPGDHVVVLTPAYQSLHALARAIGCSVAEWPLTPRAGSWALDLARLSALLQEPTRLVVVNFPNNPTGFLPSSEDWQALIELVVGSGAYLFSDEMYRLLEYEPSRRLIPACSVYERAVSLAGLSKAFGLPGLRSGWLACQDAAVLAKFQAYKDYITICASAPGEILSIIALRAAETILERNRAIVARNLEAARSFFTARPGMFEWLEPQAGSIAFPRWLGQPPLEQLAEEIVARHGVMFVPGAMFAFPGGHFRLGLGRKNLPEVLAVLGDALA